MLTLDIARDLGGDATPPQLEALVRAVRVATEVDPNAELRRVRRNASEQMKFPTDDELRAAIERFPEGDETGPRTGRSVTWRPETGLAADAERLLPEIWWDHYWYRRGGGLENDFLTGTGV